VLTGPGNLFNLIAQINQTRNLSEQIQIQVKMLTTYFSRKSFKMLYLVTRLLKEEIIHREREEEARVFTLG
jgi:hypothetical protein